jgi:glycosyltransferase involved in cell wall biosynthesis
MRQLNVLAPTRYPWRFNGPRRSRHLIYNKNFVPFNKLSNHLEGITAFPPSFRSFDLIHAFNRIPIGRLPYLIGFESHLPRAFTLENTSYFHALRRSLASKRCRSIIAISRHAEFIFRQTHGESDLGPELIAKLQVRYPNVALPDIIDETTDFGDGPIRLLFVGSHFARKGGCVAIRMAELARGYGLDLDIMLISDLAMGGGIWTDPLRKGYFDDWQARINHPTIRFSPALPNTQVLAHLRQAHFSLLATFGDTFGYSAIESMTHFCPVIGTRQGALPEFIEDDVNGILLDLPVQPNGEWIHSSSPDRGSPAFEVMFTQAIECLAHEALKRIAALATDPSRYRRMRMAARTTVKTQFGDQDANHFWDNLYEKAVISA